VRTNVTIKGESLAGIWLFADLDLQARDEIAARCVGYEFAPGVTILQHGDPGVEAFIILSGLVDVTLLSVTGKRVTYVEKGPGQLIGELAAIDGQMRCANVVAKTSCRLVSISAADFAALVARYPSVAHKMLIRMSRQIRDLSERMFDISALLVRHRIHVELLRLARRAPGHGKVRKISPAPTHASLASRLSTHREAVARELGWLMKAGLLQKARAALVVTDLDQLESYVMESRGTLPSEI